MKHKTLISALFFLVAGVVLLFIENSYFQRVDENGLLHESLFLPLGVFSLIVGFLMLLVLLAKNGIMLLSNKRPEPK